MADTIKKSKTKKRGRPATGVDPTFTLRMPVEIRKRIERFAREQDLTLAKAILLVLAKHLPDDN